MIFRRALLIGLAGLAPALAQDDTLNVSGLPSDAPLTITAHASEAQLVVDVALKPGWHLYARDVGGGRPVSVQLEGNLPFAAAAPLVAPSNDKGEIVGHTQLRLPLERIGEGNHLEATFAFQVCDALECLLPMEVVLEGEVAPLRVLVVVTSEGERATRIKDWMTERGFATTLAVYGAVTAQQCEAHDIVVADSDYFGAPGLREARAAGIPESTTPMIAVGFLGTEFVEQHGVAMTSGYI